MNPSSNPFPGPSTCCWFLGSVDIAVKKMRPNRKCGQEYFRIQKMVEAFWYLCFQSQVDLRPIKVDESQEKSEVII